VLRVVEDGTSIHDAHKADIPDPLADVC